jgi:hypothetical protein
LSNGPGQKQICPQGQVIAMFFNDAQGQETYSLALVNRFNELRCG